MDPFVPKHGPRPVGDQRCGYSPTHNEADYCNKPATWHVMWDSELDNSGACDEHMKLIESRWVFDDRHRRGADCNMPGSLWSYRNGCCYVPTDDATASTAATVEAS